MIQKMKKLELKDIVWYCMRLTDSQYDNIKEYVRYYSLYSDGDEAYNNVKIDCKSNYVQLGLLSLLLLILF